MSPELIICESANKVAERAAELFVKLCEHAVSSSGRFTVALSGGSTPRATYSLLAQEPYRSHVAWDRTHLFWGDERCVPPDHQDSNYRMAYEAMISKLPIPAGNVHRIEAEDPDVEAAAARYEQTIRKAFGGGNGEIPRFDFIMLGMGDDGHTASLFPGTKALSEQKRLVVSNWVEKFNTYRITMTTPLINSAELVAFLAPGAAKAERLLEVTKGPKDPSRLPSQLIQPQHGRLLWIIDRDAAAKL